MVHLHKDGLHLNNYGKAKLPNNFIDNIVIILRENIFEMSDFLIDSL